MATNEHNTVATAQSNLITILNDLSLVFILAVIEELGHISSKFFGALSENDKQRVLSANFPHYYWLTEERKGLEFVT
tara:strand:- start:285 stop:515 length:231 start_codon:yes stop_codon:yes gene_type:complete